MPVDMLCFLKAHCSNILGIRRTKNISMELGTTVTNTLPRADLYRKIASESEVFPISKKRIFFRKERYSIPWIDHMIPGYGPVVDHSQLYLVRSNWKEIQNFG